MIVTSLPFCALPRAHQEAAKLLKRPDKIPSLNRHHFPPKAALRSLGIMIQPQAMDADFSQR